MKEATSPINNKSCDHLCTPRCYEIPTATSLEEFHLAQVPFYFLRHGETEWNQTGLIQGCIDISLSDKGIEQAHQAAQQLKDIPIGTIITSPLQRARKTAEIIGLSLNMPVTVIEEFKNACYGSIEGKSKVEHHEAYSGWKTGYKIEGAECYSCFVRRVYKGFNKALQHPGPVLIVAHGGVHWPVQDALHIESYTIPNAMPMAHIPPIEEHHVWVIEPAEKTGS